MDGKKTLCKVFFTLPEGKEENASFEVQCVINIWNLSQSVWKADAA